MRLWYQSPAEDWNSALPLGNGKLGAMVFGGPVAERIQLNEDSVWSGKPLNRINPENDQLLQSDLTRLETIRDDLAALRRAAQDAKRREEARRKAAEKRKARQKLLRKISEASRRMAAENSANRARMEKQRKIEQEIRRKAESSPVFPPGPAMRKTGP